MPSLIFPVLDMEPVSDWIDLRVATEEQAHCDCDSRRMVCGDDADGFVLCRESCSPLFHCDLGGQGLDMFSCGYETSGPLNFFRNRLP